MQWCRNMPFVAAVVFVAVGFLAARADDGAQPLASSTPPALSDTVALAELKQIGGVLIHYDDRQSGRPVIAVDFTHHPDFQEAWLTRLAAFPRLSTLGLSGVPLTDEGLRHLRTLAELETLTLAETGVTDEGLAELLKLKKLRHLDVRGTQVTGAGITALRRFLPELEIAAGPMPDADAPVRTEGSTPKDQTSDAASPFSVAKIAELREKAVELSQPLDEEEPEGWSKSNVDPGKLVEIFAPLRLRKGHVLRAYIFREEGNGSGVVWAMPEDAAFPEPHDCPALESHLLKAPKPWDALDDPMEAIEGDGSAGSYLAASLLRRELREFGAMWHGCNWQTHVILDGDPWSAGSLREDTSPLDGPTSEVTEWTWLQPRPTQWGPQVRMENDRVIVTFHTYSGLEKESIYRHTDTYRTGSYRAKVQQETIAEGPEGYSL